MLYFAVLAPLIGLTGKTREEAEDLAFRLQRLQRVAGEKDGLLRRLDKIKAESRKEENFLPRNTASLASAELQTQIKDIVGLAGGELTSTQVIPEQDESGFTRVAIKVRMSGSTPVLRNVLHRIESAQPFLFVENLNIRPIRMPRNPTVKNPAIPDRLSIDFDVIGYMRAG